jgi:hypothetical protein
MKKAVLVTEWRLRPAPPFGPLLRIKKDGFSKVGR